MSYEKIRNKTVPKYLFGGSTYNWDASRANDPTKADYWIQQGFLPKQAEIYAQNALKGDSLYINGVIASSQTSANDLKGMNDLALNHNLSMELSKQLYNAYNGDTSKINTMFEDGLSVEDMLNADEVKDVNGNSVTVNLQEGKDFGTSQADRNNTLFQAVNYPLQLKQGMSEDGKLATNIISQGVTKAINVVDEATMGDKNFSASSQAIDQGVHGVSGALMKSGNPYAMIAGAGLEAINFITKAGGKNVQGYDVNINNSGYGNMGHMESEAGRIWDNWSGATAKKLARRNEQARMALAAADVSLNQAFEQEARANSIDNVLRQNSIALAGGIDTSLLAS